MSIRTTCAYCGVGCGIAATVTGERSVEIKGDADHPANAGKLCSKGTHLGETTSLEGRLLHPTIGGKRASWHRALNLVAKRFRDTIAQHGPNSVAFYVSGQLLTEDYYVANKLMKGFIGSANIDTNSRLCMSSAVSGHLRAFGEDVVPASYDDLDVADLVILVGSNTAWCHPVIWQRIEAARAANGCKVVVIDPRRTETAERADLHLAIAPDTDVALFNGLLRAAKDGWRLECAFMAGRVDMPADLWGSLEKLDVPAVCDIPPALWEQFVQLVLDHPRMVTLFSQGANQSVSGTDKGNAIINLHLATGRIGKPGMGPFSITGQPNAMGGREVGGLASTLACHRGFSAAERDWAQRFWNAPTIAPAPGLKAVDLFEAVAAGRVKAIWIMATNPAVSMPNAHVVRKALAACPFVVVSDCIAETDTSAFAHVKLPALGWGEKDGTVTNSERCISRQRGFLAPPGETRPDWWIVSQVASRMGWTEAFDYPSAASVFREFAAMTGYENDRSRVLDISDMARLLDHQYEGLEPFQWGGPSPLPPGKMRIVPVRYFPRDDGDRRFPLRLNTGRYRDQWHTMTRTGLSPKLSQHRREPQVEVHPETLLRHGLEDGGLAVVETSQGDSIFRVASTANQRRGELFVPMHWTDQTSGGGRAGLLPGGARDPHSGQPGFKNTPAAIRPWIPDWNGYLICRTRPSPPPCRYWTQVRTAHGWLVELAGIGDPVELLALLPTGDRADVSDPQRGMIRAAALDGGHLLAALFVARQGSLPQRDWLIEQLGGETASSLELLAGRPAKPRPERGAIVCVCFDVGLMTILDTIRSEALTSVEAVGKALNAGTNCGSCRPAIARLLETELVARSG